MDRHNLIIEANAGTGKTYKIIEEIIKILKGEGYEPTDISKILVLTFTEAATNELKERTRKKLKEKLIATENFENNSIFTIHSFCKTIMDKYPIETGSDFQYNVIKDNEIYEKALYKILNEKIYKSYDENFIKKLLLYADFPTGLESTIYELAARCDKRNGDTIFPFDFKDIKKNIDFFEEYEKKIISSYEYLKNNLNEIIKIVDSYIAQGLRDFSKSKQGRKINIDGIDKLLGDINNLLLTGKTDKSDENIVVEIVNNKEIFKKYNKYDELGKFDNKIEEFASELKKIYENANNLFKYKKLIFLILLDQLFLEIDEYKKANHLISYNDMLTIVDDSLDNNSIILEELCSNYKYLIVDEFQDTDATQWSIFKKIFAFSDKHNIIVIGDPKQAIYGFRKANVKVYEKALRDLRESGATEDTIKENYRSSKNYIEAINIIFKDRFFPNYEELKSPDKNRLCIKNNDGVSIKPITFVELNYNSYDDKINVYNAKLRYADFIVESIKELKENCKINKEREEDKLDYIDYDDICILVKSKKEAIPIENIFKKNEIPYSFYKKEGLYETKEAYNIYYLLKAIAYPEDNSNFLTMLLTKFINVDLKDLSKFDINNENSDVYRLFQNWVSLAKISQFSTLFNSIMVNSYLIFNEINNIDYERKLTNYEHIFETLLNDSIENRLNIIGIVETLEKYIKESSFTKEIDLQRLDSDKKKVKIMTMHSSKGLEFPIVYIVGGFYPSYNIPFYNFYDEEDETKNIFDLNKENKDKHNEREREENKRLFYVATTRAKFKLFIPFYNLITEKSNRKILGLIKESEDINIDELLLNYKNEFGKVLYNHYKNSDSYSKKNDNNNDNDNDNNNKDKKNGEIFETLSNKKIVDIKNRVISTSSFSSLSSIKKNDSESEKVNDNKIIDENNDNKIDENNDKIIPRGINTGYMFHKIFETIEFEEFRKIADLKELNESNEKEIIKIRNLIENWIRYYLFNSIKEENIDNSIIRDITLSVNEIIFNTLNVPIEFKDRGEINNEINNRKIILSELKSDAKINELKFTYPKKNNFNKILNNVNDIKSFDRKGYLTGYIDMIFCYKDKYYILDWKSNAYQIYEGDNFYKLVEKEYSLQYKIYSIALVKWLKNHFGDKFSLEKYFGGIIYLYLRGRSGKQLEKYGNGSGVYFIRPYI